MLQEPVAPVAEAGAEVAAVLAAARNQLSWRE